MTPRVVETLADIEWSDVRELVRLGYDDRSAAALIFAVLTGRRFRFSPLGVALPLWPPRPIMPEPS